MTSSCWRAAELHAVFFDGDYEAAIDFVDRAVASNPNDPIAWLNRGWVYKFAGQHEEAIRSFECSIRLSPLNPALYVALAGIGFALIELRRFDEAVAIAKRALRRTSPIRQLTAVWRPLWPILDAMPRLVRRQLVCLRSIPPLRYLGGSLGANKSNTKLLIEGLRKAGLPE